MEIKRELLATSSALTDFPGSESNLSDPKADFRSRQLLARDMLRGDLEGEAWSTTWNRA